MSSLNILVVDDDADIRELFKRILKTKPYKVSTVESGEAAIEAASKTPFDVAFIDMRMPKMNGLETFRALRKIYSKTAAVIITGFADENLIQAAIAEGALHCLRKPFNLKDIKGVIDEEVAKKPQGCVQILAVDDEKDICELFKRLEKMNGFGVKAASNANEALECLEKGKFDVVFIDVVLPGMDGLLLCDKLLTKYPNTKIVLYTGYSSKQEEMEKKVRQGKVLYTLSKPFDIEELRAVLEKVEATKH